jgi:hypothetical protein
MKFKRWKRFACAACLTVCTAFAYSAAAAVRCHTRGAPKPCKTETVLRGKGVVSFAGYKLNITFTPEGRIVGFDISAS